MKRILIYGGTGRTGQLVIENALNKGYAVTTLVRNLDKIKLQHPNLKVVKGSPTKLDDIRIAIQDCFAVINTLSALSEKESMSFKKIEAPNTLKTMMAHTITAMNEKEVMRIITLSSIGVGDSYKYAPWYMKLFIKISNFKIVFDDHDAQEQLLIHSNLDWTIARPVGLNNSEMKSLVISYDKTPSPFKISRGQLAKFMVDTIESKEYLRKKPILSEV